ncbi:MAG: hypothetical protein IPN90_08190 [Elusimicrobia bacterium]|nr:hypothetical protein [Elusimicrobiota bacterium]
MIEYLIRREDGDWFDFPSESNPYRPQRVPYRSIDNMRIEVEGCEISFSYEDPGIQVSFHREMAPERTEQIVREILETVSSVSGQKGRIVRIS